MPRVAVAASGGADSTALLAEAASGFPPEQVTVLTVDHGTRTAAAAERAHVQHLAGHFGFSFHALKIGAVAANQAAWRKARLAALLDYCRAHGISRLWLGHHRDDAVETAALRLLAGGKLPSLAGISAVRSEQGVAIERPLLNRSARAVRRGLMANGLAWYEDPSNRDGRYRRIAVRRLLAADGMAGAADLVHRTGTWREEHEQVAAAAWTHAACIGDCGSVWLRPLVLRALPDDLAAIVLRRAALLAAGREQRLRNVDFGAAVRAGPPAGSLGGARLWSVDGCWLVGRDYRHIQQRLPLHPGQPVQWDARYQLCLTADLGRTGWRAARLGLQAARRLDGPLPSAWQAAAFAIWCGEDLVAVPDLGVWRGRLGAQLAENLQWQRVLPMDNGLFRVAPRRQAPILRL